MKKMIKLLSLIMVLVMALSMFTGCITVESDDSGEDAAPMTMTIGLPADRDETWDASLDLVTENLKMFYNITLEIVDVPTGGKALKKFMRKVDNGKIAAFFTERQDFIATMVENKSLLLLETLRTNYDSLLEKAPDGLLSIAEEKESIKNYMYPIYGTYQGLYYNRTLFKEYELSNPTSWESILAAIPVLKEKGITPIAAGFADEGLEYMIDEMVLSEGGVAEHSYQPTFGVVSSWERAVNDIKTLEGLGAFTADCYNVNFEDAVEAFLNGEAAMIVAPSDAFGGELSQDDVKVVGFPNTPTGKREEGAFIGRINHGFYVSAEFFNGGDRNRDAIYELLNTDYLGGKDFYEIFKTEATFCPETKYYEDHGETKLDESLKAFTSKATATDWPMRDRLLTMDTTVECFRKALTGANVEESLLEATEAEIAAVEEQKKAEGK